MSGQGLDLGSTTLADEDSGDGSISSASCTDVGKKRDCNQDCVLALQESGENRCLLVVADGMGGHLHGERASAEALASIRDLYMTDRLADESSIVKAFNDIDRHLHKSLEGGGTTLVVALIEDATLTVANIGDSRAYLLRSNSFQQLTEDDSWVQSQVRSGHISAEQARTHPRRNVLIKAMGPGRQEGAAVSSMRFLPGDTILLCSDGLHGVVTDEQIERALRQPVALSSICSELIELALSAGGPDNISVALCRSDERRETSVE